MVCELNHNLKIAKSSLAPTKWGQSDDGRREALERYTLDDACAMLGGGGHSVNTQTQQLCSKKSLQCSYWLSA
jgi:hypothetical protein